MRSPLRMGWIGRDKLLRRAEVFKKNEYGVYLQALAEGSGDGAPLSGFGETQNRNTLLLANPRTRIPLRDALVLLSNSINRR